MSSKSTGQMAWIVYTYFQTHCHASHFGKSSSVWPFGRPVEVKLVQPHGSTGRNMQEMCLQLWQLTLCFDDLKTHRSDLDGAIFSTRVQHSIA